MQRYNRIRIQRVLAPHLEAWKLSRQTKENAT